MELLQLKLLLSLSRTLNFTKTAGEFYMTQPAVSHQIRALEKSLGVKLLERNSHHVGLTPEGQEYVAYASRILALQAAAENRIQNLRKGRRGQIHIAMLSSAAQMFSECLHKFTRLCPDVQVDVDMLEGGKMIEAISRCDCDVYFANEPMMPENSRVLDYKVTGTSQLHLFVNNDAHPDIDISDWSTVGKHRFVSVPETDFTLSSQIKKLCSNRGIIPDIINFYNRADTILLSVNSGVGIAILPPELFDPYRYPNVRALRIEGSDAALNSVVAWHKDGSNPHAARFLELLPPCKRQGDK
ncbi:MAG: LysR family transcriptional regulator [Clostridiales bacterium]|nr:LysR family transcriptional regulator [Clostridiales bacterium]